MELAGAPAVADIVAERVRRLGPLPFDEVVDLALYHPDAGFYAAVGEAGRHGDFLTSPEVGPVFGAVLGRALDRWWRDLGRPDPFVVVEGGAGTGRLAADVLGSSPECAPALRYVAVERSERFRRRQGGLVPLEPPGLVLGPVVGAPDAEEGPRPLPRTGPLVTSLAELPAGPFTGVVWANELLDALPFRLLARARLGAGAGGGTAGGWEEVRVGERLEEVLVPAAPDDAAMADVLAPGAPPGGRIPLQHHGVGWLRAALGCLERGRLVAFDYADTTPSMARRPWTDWVRTYRRQSPGAHPLADLGRQDITCEVAVDQLARVRRPALQRSQADFLEDFGIDELVEAARRLWRRRAWMGDMAAIQARSRISEADALTDRAGLGGFQVLEWDVR